MADNTTLNAGTGGDTISTDDIAGIKVQRVKVQYGLDGSATDVSDTNPLPIDDAGGSLTVDNAGTFATQATLQAGTASIGKLGANSGVDIGDVDVTSVIPGTGATNLGKAEDAAHTTGDTGIMALGVQNTTLAALAGTDGDYAPFQVDEDGAVWVHDKNHIVDSNNSTTTPLAGDAVYTGTGTDLLSYASISVLIDSSHNSATDGMTFQFSTDNTNWDKIFTYTYTAANSGRVFAFPIHARYFRIVYTNGSTLQTTFRVSTILLHTHTTLLVDRLVDNVNPDKSAALVKSAIIAQAAGTGDFIPVQATTGGNLKISLEESDPSATLAVTNAGTFAVQISDTSFAVADGSALGEGILIQGDDGTDRKNINVDATTGDVQVDVTNTVTVDGSGVTQPVSGTVTETNSAAIKTAVEIIDNSILAEDAAFSGGSVNMSGAIRDDVLSTLTPIEGDAVPLRVNSTGALHVTGGGGGTQYSVDDAAPTVVTMAGAIRDDSLTTLTEVDGDATLLRVSSTGALHVTGGGGGTEYTEDIATPATIVGTATMMERDDVLSAVTPIEGDWIGLRGNANGALWTAINGTVTVDGSGVTQPVSGTVTANPASGTIDTVTNLSQMGGVAISLNTGVRDTGTQRVTIATDDSVPVTNAGTFATQATLQTGSSLVGDVGISVRTSGGTTIFRSIDLDETEEEIKATAGQVYWLHCMNLSASTIFLKIYNATAATVVVGTTTPVLTFPIPTQGDTNGAGFTLSVPNGIAFGTAITAACTTGIADADTGAPAANVCILNLGYA